MAKPYKKNSKKKVKPSRRTSRLVSQLALLLAVIGGVLYVNTLGHGYTLDDYSVIKENNVVRQGTDGIKTILSTSYRYGYLSINDGLYRPLSLIMFAVEWELFGENTTVHHSINVLFYGATGFVLFLLLVKILPKQSLWVPFISTLLFMVHPIHTEIVASIKSRDEIMSLFLMLSAFYVLISKNSKLSFVWSALLFFLGLLAKETGIVMVLIFPLTFYFFVNPNLKEVGRKAIPFVLATVAYFFLRANVLGDINSLTTVSYIDNPIATASFPVRVSTALKVLIMYLALLIYPGSLTCDRSFNHIELAQLLDPIVIVSALLHLGLLVWAIWNVKRRNPLAYATLFYLIAIALFSNLFVVIGSIMAERFVYFASLGFCLGVTLLVSQFVKFPAIEKAKSSFTSFFASSKQLLAGVLVITVFAGFKTIDRSTAWKDNVTLYRTDVENSPNSTRIHYYLGRELIKEQWEIETDTAKKKELLREGIEELKKTIAITPDYGDAYSQMGIGYSRLGQLDMAIDSYNEALKINPNDVISLNNLASEYFKQQRIDECVAIYEKVIALDPRYVDAIVNLGACYGTKARYQEAITMFSRALQIDPNNATARKFLEMTKENMK